MSLSCENLLTFRLSCQRTWPRRQLRCWRAKADEKAREAAAGVDAVSSRRGSCAARAVPERLGLGAERGAAPDLHSFASLPGARWAAQVPRAPGSPDLGRLICKWVILKCKHSSSCLNALAS